MPMANRPDSYDERNRPGAGAEPGNHPLHERALEAMWAFLDVCEEAEEELAAHAEACPDRHCYLCYVEGDLRQMAYTVRVYESMLDGIALPFPGRTRRLKEETFDVEDEEEADEPA